MTEKNYDELTRLLKKATLLKSCSSVLGWDEQTYLPPAGGEHRADQLSLLAGLSHELSTDPRIGEWLTELEQSGNGSEPDSPTAVNIREARRDYDLATRLPNKLVQEISRVTSLGQQAWIAARKQDDFSKFLPWLEQIVKLKCEQADALGDGKLPLYDALLDQYEAGATTESVQSLFTPLQEALVPLVQAIQDSGKIPQRSLLRQHYDRSAQEQFCKLAAEQMGFDLTAGRIDETTHPFCSGFGPGDCRLTTRYNENSFADAFFSVLHEAGHGMYEQGLDDEYYGTPMGESVSLGIHESQSRLWENLVGRSLAYWQYQFPAAQKAFSAALRNATLEDFYWAVNDVHPSFIRVEADEVTYNLHIMLRFEMEQALIARELKPAEVPGIWNEKMQSYLGITPENNREGCLQDIHWSAGLIGYFPTYALGNMYGAQFFNTAQNELGDLNLQFSQGEFAPLLNWLRENIHRRGRQFRPRKLVEVVCGQSLAPDALISQLRNKFEAIYGL